MLRSCLLMLALYAALFAAYSWWLGPQFDPPWVYVGVGVLALVVAGCLGALVNARLHYRLWSLLAAARHNLPWMDGRWTAACGEVHPVHEPLSAPFSGQECVMCEYDVSRRPTESGKGQTGAGSEFVGFLMNPTVLRTQSGDLRLLGFPDLAEFAERRCDGPDAIASARTYLNICKFEDYSGLKLVSVVGAITDAWQDDDGLVRKNLRLGKLQPADLFPAEPAPMAAETPANPPPSTSAAERGEKVDEDADEDWDEDLSGPVGSPPILKEKRVKVGEKVCAIGIYSQARGGLTPAGFGADKSIRLMRGNLEAAQRKARSTTFSHLLGGLAVLALANAAAWGVLMANRHHPAAVSKRTSAAFQAVQKGDAAALEKQLSRGLDINVRQSGRTLLHDAVDPACASLLIARGADVNAVSEEQRTPLMEAARRGRREIAQLLIDARAELNLVSASERRTALDYARLAGSAEIEQLLRQAGGRQAPPAENAAP
jgi:hypothetical protein